jgi:GNAT superfamily N-acetyltransferase
MPVSFSHGGDIEELRSYLNRIGLTLGSTEEKLIQEKKERLIIWKDEDEIIGHSIWHISNSKKHPDGEPREENDRNLLEKKLKVIGDFIELHEIWLSNDHRGRGYGTRFFEYFENMIKRKGYNIIVYYANHPAALAICRNRGYKEAFGVELDGMNGKTNRFYVLAKKFDCTRPVA